MGTSIFGTAGGALVGTNTKLYENAIVVLTGEGSDTFILLATARQQQVDFQILRSIGGDYVLNVFGDMPVMMTLTGLQPIQPNDKTCQNASGSSANIKKAIDAPIETWYQKHKLSGADPKKLSVSIGTVVFSGYAVRLDSKPHSAGQGGYEYTMTVIALPSKNG